MSAPTNGIPNMFISKIPEIEYHIDSQDYQLLPKEWAAPNCPDPGNVDLVKMKGHLFLGL